MSDKRYLNMEKRVSEMNVESYIKALEDESESSSSSESSNLKEERINHKEWIERKSAFSFGKFDQLKEVPNFSISDELLDNYLSLNFKHLGLARGENQDEDVSLISWYTKSKFLVAIPTFSALSVLKKDEASLLPFVRNIVCELSPTLDEKIPNFNGKLYAPQSGLLQRMLDIESNLFEFNLSSGSKVKIPAGIVSERLSFGKTFCLPALCCQRLVPFEPTSYHIKSESEVIQTNLVLCGGKVAKEWKNNLKKFVSLRWCVVELQNNLKELEDLCSKGNFPEILVVKDGDITYNGKKDKALVHVLAILKNKTFSRLICDDYDMLKYPSSSNGYQLPEALFTWFVSGTSESHPNIAINVIKNDEPELWNLARNGLVLEYTTSVRCNREYSVVEYNVPKIDVYWTAFKLQEIVKRIVDNKPIDSDSGHTEGESVLLGGVQDVPYTYDKSKLKILVTLENKNDQLALIKELNDAGIKAVKLTRANVNKFEREDAVVCVAGNLFGVNMGFLTHIVINAEDYLENARVQIIGRGQRLGRKQNLQVYMNMHVFDDEETR